MADEATRRWMALDLWIALGRDGVEFDDYFQRKGWEAALALTNPDYESEGPFFEGRR